MMELAKFGDPARFEIALRWVEDPEPRERRPFHGGWSTGELRITVGHHVLTQHHHLGEHHETIRWYLLPVIEWIAENWVFILHEERFAWRENSAAPAATAVFFALHRLIDAVGGAEQDAYVAAQDWWSRHALRASDASGLYPDVVFRRLGDDLELSWTSRQPVHAPDGFRFALAPGAATLPIETVAGPLWEAMAWVSATASVDAADQASLTRLERRISDLAHMPTRQLEAGFLPAALFERVITSRNRMNLSDRSDRLQSIPAIIRLDDAVLMFGGVNPELGVADIEALTGFLASQSNGSETEEIRARVDLSIGAPLTAPFEEGYDLAERLLEDLAWPDGQSMIDIRALLRDLSVSVREQKLITSTIRGVAVAGRNYVPSILVNTSSRFNDRESGRRFTLAHELFHILYDRTRARRLTHISGPWAAPGVEKRANAFAAMLLMPRALLRQVLPKQPFTRRAIDAAAKSMHVGVSALIEHLYNTGMIDDFERDDVRARARTS